MLTQSKKEDAEPNTGNNKYSAVISVFQLIFNKNYLVVISVTDDNCGR